MALVLWKITNGNEIFVITFLSTRCVGKCFPSANNAGPTFFQAVVFACSSYPRASGPQIFINTHGEKKWPPPLPFWPHPGCLSPPPHPQSSLQFLVEIIRLKNTPQAPRLSNVTANSLKSTDRRVIYIRIKWVLYNI